MIKLLCFGLLAAACTMTSCDDWTDMEALDKTVERPQEKDPELWAQYTAALREYKQSEHVIIYARLYNSPEVAVSEKDFMRCLPDSLDIVSLTNADHFSKHDLEDLFVMKEKGIKVLYQVDFAGRTEELSDMPKLTDYLDRVIAAVNANRLDGYAFTGVPKLGDAATEAASKLLVTKLSAARTDGQLLVFEGNPLFIAPEDRSRIDYFVLDSELTNNATELKMQVFNATGYAAVPAEKLLLAASAGLEFIDEQNGTDAAITSIAERVVTLGPLCGLGVYNIGDDYYNAGMNYKLIRNAIQTLNPSK